MQTFDAQNTAEYADLISSIGRVLDEGRDSTARVLNSAVLNTYWQVGRFIVEYEQRGHKRAEYGSMLLTQMSRDLTARHGNGFSKSNLFSMRRLYLLYP